MWEMDAAALAAALEGGNEEVVDNTNSVENLNIPKVVLKGKTPCATIFSPNLLFLCMYIGLTIWATLNTFALEMIALIDAISIWCQGIGGLVIVIMLPLVALTTKSVSFVFTHFELAPESAGISSKPYAVILSFLVSQYSLYGYDAAAHQFPYLSLGDKAVLQGVGSDRALGMGGPAIGLKSLKAQDLEGLFLGFVWEFGGEGKGGV